MPRRNNRAPQPELPVILPSFQADTEGLWAITVTNGVRRALIEVSGRKDSAWAWATMAGASGGLGAGKWWPVEITSAANVISREPFLAIA